MVPIPVMEFRGFSKMATEMSFELTPLGISPARIRALAIEIVRKAVAECAPRDDFAKRQSQPNIGAICIVSPLCAFSPSWPGALLRGRLRLLLARHWPLSMLIRHFVSAHVGIAIAITLLGFQVLGSMPRCLRSPWVRR